MDLPWFPIQKGGSLLFFPLNPLIEPDHPVRSSSEVLPDGEKNPSKVVPSEGACDGLGEWWSGRLTGAC